MKEKQIAIVFISGVAVGSCIAFALLRYAASPKRQWSWKEWRSWRALNFKPSPPTTPTKKEWNIPGSNEQNSSIFSHSWPQITDVKGHLSTSLSYSYGKSPIIMSSPSDHVQLENLPSNDEILSEQFSRNVQFFGEGQSKVHSSFVIVIGLGGVGSHAAAMLLRSGVSRLRIVDFDQVSLSSLNRHAVATRSDVGLPKAVCLKNHLLKIYSEADIEAWTTMFQTSNAHQILADHPDFVLDCIDNIDTKVELLAACVKRNIRVISATGAGARADPTRIRIADISESSVDPLSRVVRYRLRKEHGIERGIHVVFSTEKPKAKLLPFLPTCSSTSNEEIIDPSQYQIVPGFRVRVIPVLGTIPAIFGQTMASFVITKLASNLDVSYEPVIDLSSENYTILHRRLVEREEQRFGSDATVDLDVADVAYLIREIWKGQSAKDCGQTTSRANWRSINQMTLTRWNQTCPPTIDNLVLLTFKEAEVHESLNLDQIQNEDSVFFSFVKSILSKVKHDYYIG